MGENAEDLSRVAVHRFATFSVTDPSLSWYVFLKSTVEEIQTFRSYMNNGVIDGRLHLSKDVFRSGNNGTSIYHGRLNDVDVAVKYITLSTWSAMYMFHNPNMVHVYNVLHDKTRSYICMELCQWNLKELINAKKNDPNWKNLTYPPSSCMLSLMRDVVNGLDILHNYNGLHLNLKPENILIVDNCPMIGKISCPEAINNNNNPGWQSPEQIKKAGTISFSTDMFTFGCIFFYSITGNHPFTDSLILKKTPNFNQLKRFPEALHLITNLLQSNPVERFTAAEVLRHPVFWDGDTRMSFLQVVSDEAMVNSAIMADIKNLTHYTSWDAKLDVNHVTELDGFIKKNNKKKPYDKNKVDGHDGLLRFIRNTVNHLTNMSPNVQASIGNCNELLDLYISTHFPNLLMEIYNIMPRHAKGKPKFKKYFR